MFFFFIKKLLFFLHFITFTKNVLLCFKLITSSFLDFTTLAVLFHGKILRFSTYFENFDIDKFVYRFEIIFSFFMK